MTIRHTHPLAIGTTLVSLSALFAAEVSAQPIAVSTYIRSEAFPGLGTETNNTFRVFTLDGKVVHTWQNPYGPTFVFAELVKPLPGRRLLATAFDWNLRFQSPHPKKLLELDWDGNVMWEYDPSPNGSFLHHDFQRLNNGNTLVLTQTLRSVPAIKPGMIWDDSITEIDPQGNAVWSWSVADNMSQLPLTPENWQTLALTTGVTVFHANAIQELPANHWESTDPRFAAGNILVSVRNLNLTMIIEKSTGTVVWTYLGTIAQHHARMIPKGLRGEGNILIFDNGGTAGAPQVTRNYSRVIELDPVTFNVVWSYECPSGCFPPRDTDQEVLGATFYSYIMGAAQRLANGNTLITESTSGRVFEITPRKVKVWEATINGVAYRSYRWPLSWEQGSTELGFVW